MGIAHRRAGSARRLGFAVFAALALVSTLAVARPADAGTRAAAPTVESRPGRMVLVRAGQGGGAQTNVPARSSSGARTTYGKSSFVVKYTGFTPAARASFQRAVDLWSRLVTSKVPIRINATFSDLGPGVLGSAGPEDYYRNFPHAPHGNTWYASALANALAGTDVNTGSDDIRAQFDNDPSTWYFGTDGNTPVGKYDFTSVVLHELGHGLGFAGSIEYQSGLARYGYGTNAPFAYDRLTYYGNTPITSFQNEGSAMGSAVTSNNIFWAGGQATAANGGVRPKLYAPSTWSDGSSIAHLDDATYPQGNPNSLMTPFINDGESIFDPGDIALGMFRDTGWKTATARSAPSAPTIVGANVSYGRATLTWSAPKDNGRSAIPTYRIRRYVGGSSTASVTTDTGSAATTAALTGLNNGTTYRFTVSAVNGVGSSTQSAKSEALVPVDTAPFGNSETFVQHQFQDFVGRNPTAAELKTWRTAINNGSYSPAGFIAKLESLDLVDGSIGSTVRLYTAYFLRQPDKAGLAYWSGRIQKGATVSSVSSAFAASSEFETRYGNLSNTQFVKLVYQNVLGRQPDTAGLNYWVGQLNGKKKSRGQVMTGFSESSENKRLTIAAVRTITTYFGMLRRTPTASEFDTATGIIDGGGSVTSIVTPVLTGTEYANRF